MEVRPPIDISVNSGKNKPTIKGVVCLDRGLWYSSMWTVLKYKRERILLSENNRVILQLTHIVLNIF